MSNQQEILPRVRELVAEALTTPVDQIDPQLEFGGIPAWDSMGHMSIMMLLEEKFGVEIDAEKIAALTSIPAICDYVSKE
jgi:acyl carrier protein